MSLIGLFLIVVFGIFIFGISILSSFVRTIFGFGKRTADSFTGSETKKKQSKTRVKQPGVKKKKVFEDNEGEYVEFEEISDSGNIKN